MGPLLQAMIFLGKTFELLYVHTAIHLASSVPGVRTLYLDAQLGQALNKSL
jgi:hypothetical protein